MKGASVAAQDAAVESAGPVVDPVRDTGHDSVRAREIGVEQRHLDQV
jgi:hypothetical protein